MEFRLLGPLEVRDGSRTLTIGAPKQRALLAYLLLHRGEVVPVGRLADALWEDAPPATATKTIQVYVAQLRKTLGGDLLATEPGGYAAALNGHELDVDRFQLELDEGGRAIEAGEHAAAARALGDALSLWRGAPLADLPQTHAIRDHAARLEEERLWALEHRIDADLALGRHERLVPELQELVREHPLRERLRAQLMTALYRCGRQAEALESYREGRALLVEQLGLEPDEELQQLERAILTHDPALHAPRRLPRLRRRRLAGLAAGALLTVTAVLAVVMHGEQDTAGAPAVRGDALLAVDAAGGRIADQIRVGRSPSAVTAGEDGVWVLNADDRTISRVDPRTRDVHTFGIGASPTDVALGLGAVWVGNGGTVGRAQFAGETATALTQLDPDTGVERGTTPLPRSGDVVSNRAAQHIAFAGGSVWAINPDFSVSRIDPGSGRVLAVVRGLLALGLAGAGDELWALTDDRTVTRIDTRRNRVARRIRVRAVALDAIALGAGSVWATDPTAGVLWRIDPSAQIVQRTIDVGAGADGVAYGADAVWLSNSVLGTLTRVDPASNRVARTLAIPGAPHAVAVSGATVWVAVSGDAAPAPAVQAATGAVQPVSATACGPLLAGPDAPERLVVSDLPLRNGTRTPARQMGEAVLHVLRRHHFRAGRWALGYQSCDDSVARTGQFDPGKCAANARAYRMASSLVGVVGPMNSPCAAAQLPILDRGGPAMVSPTNSDPALTRRPTPGPRGYARLLAPDDALGAGQAVLVQRLGATRPFVLDDGAYGATIARPAARALERLGITAAGAASWDFEKRRYAALARRVARARPDSVVMCGLLDTDAAAVLTALRRRLGAMPIVGCDGMLPTSRLFQRAGAAAAGTYIAIQGLITDRLPPAGRAFVRDFGAAHRGASVTAYAVYAAQATEVLLAAIARSDGTRAGVRRELMRTRVSKGLIGSFAFDARGDPDPAPISVVRAERPGSDLRVLTYDGARVLAPIVPPWELWGAP